MNMMINQLGYVPGMTKVAAMVNASAPEMQVINAQGETVLTLPVPQEHTELWGDQVTHVDFTRLKAPGR